MLGEFVGQQFGNYYLHQLLDRGSFAEVYLGEHIYLKTLAAIKILRTHLHEESRKAFLHEAQTIARLEHPHIIHLLEFGVEQEQLFLVTNYAPRGTLRQHFPRGLASPPAAIIVYLKQIASALDYAHSQKVIHRDVKPENILLKTEEELVLSDFGLATLSQSSQGTPISQRAGTLMYMAPEQIQGQACPASDQYALGVMIYEWLTGRPPFEGTQTELIAQHLSAPPPPMHLAPGSRLEEVVGRALRKKASERYPCLSDFALAFEQEAGLLTSARHSNSAIESDRDVSATLLNQASLREEKALVPPISEREQLPLSRSIEALPEESNRLLIALLPTVPMASIARTPEHQSQSAIQALVSTRQMRKQSRRRVLLGLAGMIATGIGGAGLTALLLHSQAPMALSSRQQAPGTIASPTRATSTNTDASTIPGSQHVPVGKASPASTPAHGTTNPSIPSPTPGIATTPTPGLVAPLRVQILDTPETLVNRQIATIEVMASEPEVLITLDVSYNISADKGITVTQQADSNGYAPLSWKVKIPQKPDKEITATLLVSAQDTQGRRANAQPVSLPVSN